MQKKTCWVITGPTACGKTALSIRIAAQNNCEIICMDSMQIYRGMNIGTAKPTPEEMCGIPHHMLDIADPDDDYSVAMYTEHAEKIADQIFSRGHIPLFVGGTGFYLRALRHPMSMGNVGADPVLRSTYEKLAAQPQGDQTLHAMLAEIDPESAARLHMHDTRRVIRALQVYKQTGIPFSQQDVPAQEAPYDYKVVCLTMDRSLLYQRIEKRVDIMMRDGLLDEVNDLLHSGIPMEAKAFKAIGYKELLPVLNGQQSLPDAVNDLKKATRHYAKRQLTWMRREENVCWVDIMQPDAFQTVEAYLKGE